MRNTAIDFSKGKYICFLDIDDYWLQISYKEIKKYYLKIVLLSLSFQIYKI